MSEDDRQPTPLRGRRLVTLLGLSLALSTVLCGLFALVVGGEDAFEQTLTMKTPALFCPPARPCAPAQAVLVVRDRSGREVGRSERGEGTLQTSARLRAGEEYSADLELSLGGRRYRSASVQFRPVRPGLTRAQLLQRLTLPSPSKLVLEPRGDR